MGLQHRATSYIYKSYIISKRCIDLLNSFYCQQCDTAALFGSLPQLHSTDCHPHRPIREELYGCVPILHQWEHRRAGLRRLIITDYWESEV